jgi:hypothetical protein
MTAAGDRRATIIAKIRLGLGTYDSVGRRATVARRLAEPAQPLVPERAKKQADERRVQLRTSWRVSRQPSSRRRPPRTFLAR